MLLTSTIRSRALDKATFARWAYINWLWVGTAPGEQTRERKMMSRSAPWKVGGSPTRISCSLYFLGPIASSNRPRIRRLCSSPTSEITPIVRGLEVEQDEVYAWILLTISSHSRSLTFPTLRPFGTRTSIRDGFRRSVLVGNRRGVREPS